MSLLDKLMQNLSNSPEQLQQVQERIALVDRYI
jgi:hypothetical protein